MNDTILVKTRCGKNVVSIRTISRKNKSFHCFVILRESLIRLERDKSIVVSDCSSFAMLELCMDSDGTQMLRIFFTWLQAVGNSRMAGWKETVCLPYAPFHDFVTAEEEMAGREWKQLSIPEISLTQLEFHSRKNLKEAVNEPLTRRKLKKVFNSDLSWQGYEKFVITDDWMPYSFLFQGYTARGIGICGGIILHNSEDLRKAYDGIHT